MLPLQIHLNISMAAAAAYLSLLIGRQIPPSMAFYGYVGILGTAASFPMNKLCLDSAGKNGITTIVVSASQVGMRGI
jgi:predicted ATP-dependent serine protease